MILVTDAAGKIGRAIIRALAKSGEPVRALMYRFDQVSSLKALGVEDVLVGDLCKLADMEQAVQGVRTIYHMAPNISPDEVPIGENFIAAAQSADVGYFVFHSVLPPQIETMPHLWRKSRVKELLFATGLSFTILQPTVYMQNVLAYWDQIIKNVIYPVPYLLATRLSLVDLEDVAEAVAIVHTEPGHNGATIELVGTAAMSQIEIVESLNEQLGHPVAAEVVPLEVWERGARASGLGDYQILTLIKMFRYYENCGFMGNSNALDCLLRRPPHIFFGFYQMGHI